MGAFDSGSGGLSVLDDIVQHEGLVHESYIYMGDMANMPYGSYSLENNTELLIENVMKDVQFLLGNKYYCSGNAIYPQTDKYPVKAIVIACNTANAPRADYKGPTESGSGDMKIEMDLWERYDSDLGNGAMLFEGDAAAPSNIQINSAENYIAFHVVSLMKKIRKTEGALPLNSVVLACNHYPFFTETYRNEFKSLRDYRENGECIYRSLIAGDLILINPAVEVADQLYEHLASLQLLNESTGEGSEFYISVTSLTNKQVELRDDGSFTYEYKYGRKAGEIQECVKVIPFRRRSIPDDVLKRLSVQIPGVWELITEFSTASPKTGYLEPAERITGE